MKKFIIAIIIIAVFSYLGYIIFTLFIFNHNSVYDFDKYKWIFKEYAIADLDSFIHNGEEGANDSYYSYFYRKDIGITIFELKNQEKCKITDSFIKKDCNLDVVRFETYETLNSNSSPKILVSSEYKSGLLESIDINTNSTIEKTFKGSNYVGLKGRINKISLTNNLIKQKLLFELDQEENNVVLIVYKHSKSIFLILFDSQKPISESVSGILKFID